MGYDSNNDIPYLTPHEIRGLIYIHDVNQEYENTPNLAELERATGWNSKYFTNVWKKLVPKNLVNRDVDGNNTRLSTTEIGGRVVDRYKELNQLFEQAEH
jgi:DNA-binding MarR family transcriptional regulator